MSLAAEKPNSNNGGIISGLWSSFNGSFRNNYEDDDDSEEGSFCLLDDMVDDKEAKKSTSTQKVMSMMSASMPDLDTGGDLFISSDEAHHRIAHCVGE